MNKKQDENQFNFLFGIPQNANAKITHNSLDRNISSMGRQQYMETVSILIEEIIELFMSEKKQN